MKRDFNLSSIRLSIFRRLLVSSCLSVRLSVRMAPAGRIFMKFYI